ncbi:MAG TPA: ribbon-helix-helix protein, CopG family, partial [Anaerolineae bacterium]
MKTIQITLPDDMLARLDEAVAERGNNRSALARQAFEDLLFRFWVEKMEKEDAEGYARQPQDPDEVA